MSVHVKICGITRQEDARAAVASGASAIGFVFWPASPRAVAPERAAAIAALVPPFIARVGVFVNAAPDDVARIVQLVGLTAVQLHGDEDVAAYRRIAVPLVKAVTLESADDVARAGQLPPDVTPLVDAADRERRGGTGRLASWPFAAELARSRPIVLSGGLNAENVGAAVRAVRPWAVDVSSGVESSPGVKDQARVKAFFAALGAEERAL